MANPFYFRNGEEAKDVDEFYTQIRKVKASEFDFHVSDKKNDFADWIEHLGKKSLAKKVRKQDNITQLRRLLKKELSTPKKTTKKKSKKTKKATKSKKNTSSKKKPKKTKKKTKKSKTSTKSTKTKKSTKRKKKPKKKEKEHSRSKKVSASQLQKTSDNLEKQYKISTEAPHVFILKEFLFGALFGLVLGLILTAIFIRAGIVM